jgi:hypothetical protein
MERVKGIELPYQLGKVPDQALLNEFAFLGGLAREDQDDEPDLVTLSLFISETPTSARSTNTTSALIANCWP